MGFLDSLFGKACPRCGTKGAKESGGRILCPNPTCAYYDASRGGGTSAARFASPSSGGGFTSASGLAIRYQTASGEEKTFDADASSGVWHKNHLSVKVAPRGVHLTLSRDRILNLSEIESAFPARVAPEQERPSRVERQILNFHKKRGSTSPRYEALRAKYPDW
ncbi:MAG: hypothetical protein LAP13_00210 [Acidobacteriia bacterium]|nr:hypothetical protein [Terriglobia bacterium]